MFNLGPEIEEKIIYRIYERSSDSHKKGGKKAEDCSNYRGISLLSIPNKVISKIILSRLVYYVNEIIKEHQAGFKKGDQQAISYSF